MFINKYYLDGSMAIEVALSVIQWVGGIILTWLKLFAAPILYPGMLWIIVPIYLSWIVTEFYQEKRGTNFGNAITNGVVILWVSIDWTRTMINGNLAWTGSTILKIVVITFVFFYGFVVVWHGIQTRTYVHYLGKIRNVSYVMIMLTPLMYGVIPFTWKLVLGIIVFYPVFYYLVELADYIIPDPKAVKLDVQDMRPRPYMPPYSQRTPLQFVQRPMGQPPYARKAF